MTSVTPAMEQRASPYTQRRMRQSARLKLPRFPTTTIGSFPQTAEVRHVRAALVRGDARQADYDRAIEGWIADAIRWQEEIGLDVLVHGEFERNDMVKYFAEQLQALPLPGTAGCSHMAAAVSRRRLSGAMYRGPTPMTVVGPAMRSRSQRNR